MYKQEDQEHVVFAGFRVNKPNFSLVYCRMCINHMLNEQNVILVIFLDQVPIMRPDLVEAACKQEEKHR